MRMSEKRSEKGRKMPKADVIRAAAEKYGPNHSNKWLRERIRAEYSVDVLDSQIVNVLGKIGYRDRILDENIKHYARNLSLACGHDRQLIYRAVQKYCDL